MIEDSTNLPSSFFHGQGNQKRRRKKKELSEKSEETKPGGGGKKKTQPKEKPPQKYKPNLKLFPKLLGTHQQCTVNVSYFPLFSFSPFNGIKHQRRKAMEARSRFSIWFDSLGGEVYDYVI